MKQNILVLNYEFPPLGWWAAPVSYDISKWYVDAGYDVDVVTMGYKGLSLYENKDWINIYRVKCLRKRKEVCHPWEQLTYLISWYFKVKELLKIKKYDLCHCHFLIPTGILSLILKKKFWLKYIITSHWSDVPWHNPDRFIFLHKFTPWILRRVINASEMVITPSNYLACLVKKNIKGINKDVQIIPNWIDTNRFVPMQKKKIILGTWRLWPLKGLHLLAEAFSQIHDVKWYELHICWDGPLMDKLKAIEKKSKNKIVLHWWLDKNSEEYRCLLWKAKIYCLPSVSESGSLSLLEWMSTESVIITTKKWVCLEMAKDIWIYIEPTVESIKIQLEKLIKNDNLCDELWKRAREKAVNCYDKIAIIEKYIKVCERYL